MGKFSCGCTGCLSLMFETIAFLAVFAFAIGATVMPLIW